MGSPHDPASSGEARAGRLLCNGLVCLLLALLTAAAYARVTSCGFVFDDDSYVVANPHVQEGLDAGSIRWALGSGHASNWHPLTWLSHMLDVELFGLEPAGHHVTNLLLHILSTLVLYVALERMTAARWRSAFTAALFALHPTHVESVAWVAERKDVLSGLFWMLTLGGYAWYVRRPGRLRYLIVVLVFALGLTAKQMLVTLPFVLLLLDVWPLGRLRGRVDRGAESTRPEAAASWRGSPTPLGRLVLEKVPLLALSVAASVATLIAQRRGGALVELEAIPLALRLQNALVAYLAYLGKLVWPTGLSAFYPFDADIPAWKVGLAALVLAVVTVASLLWLRRRPYVAVGWLWYLGTLVPVIGLAQIGQQAMADRYTYLPSIGVFLAVCWLLPDLFARTRVGARILAAGGAVVLLLLAVRTHQQVGVWESDRTLFEHALAVDADNYLAENNLGEVLIAEGRLEDALERFRRSAELKPDFALAHSNLGAAALDLGRIDEAVEHNRRAVELDAADAFSRLNLGNALGAAGRYDEAAEAFAEALRIDPTSARAHLGLGHVRTFQGRPEEAVECFRQVLAVEPDNVAAHLRLALRLVAAGRTDEAVEHLQAVLELQPQNAEALTAMGTILVGTGRPGEAFGLLVRAADLAPQRPDVHLSLAHALLAQGQVEPASQGFAAAVQLSANANAEFLGYGWTLPQQARLGHAHALAALGRAAQAAGEYEAAVRLAPQWPPALSGLAWLLATTEDDGVRDVERAATLAAQACRLTSDADPKALDALAAAQAGQGEFDTAVETAGKALEAAQALGRQRLTQALQQRIEGYRQGREFRQRALDLGE